MNERSELLEKKGKEIFFLTRIYYQYLFISIMIWKMVILEIKEHFMAFIKVY